MADALPVVARGHVHGVGAAGNDHTAVLEGDGTGFSEYKMLTYRYK